MYMSYCRFEGTQMELNACLGEVYDHLNEEAEYEVYEVSEREIDCFREMIYDFINFLNDTEILDENGEVNEEMLDDVCDAMRKSFSVEEE